MPSSRPRQRFLDIIENIEAIGVYTRGMDSDAFRADRKTVDAVERCLSRISEAAVKLGDTADTLAPDQRWRNIRDIGNHLRHGYDGLDEEQIWGIVENRLASLKTACKNAILDLPNET